MSVIESRSRLDGLTSSWDDLAVATSRPYCAPGWMLSWYDHVRPHGSTLRCVAVGEGAELVGLAPFSVTTDRWGIRTGNLLGHDTSSYSEPLSTEQNRVDVAAALAATVGSGRNRVDVLSLSGIPQHSPWPGLIQDAWPGRRPRLSIVSTMQAPFVEIPAGGFDEWFSGRSRNFRQQIRSRKREFLRRGGTFSRATSAAEMLRAVGEFERLHRGRWSGRGGSRALVAGVPDMLATAAGALGPDRMHIWTAEAEGQTLAAMLFVSAGEEMHFWLGGFDETWASLSLSLLLLVESVHYAAQDGYNRVNLGPGAQAYKYRLATGEERLDWVDLVAAGPRYPYVRLVQAPRRLRALAARRIPPHVKQRIRTAVAGVPGRSASTERRSEQE